MFVSDADLRTFTGLKRPAAQAFPGHAGYPLRVPSGRVYRLATGRTRRAYAFQTRFGISADTKERAATAFARYRLPAERWRATMASQMRKTGAREEGAAEIKRGQVCADHAAGETVAR